MTAHLGVMAGVAGIWFGNHAAILLKNLNGTPRSVLKKSGNVANTRLSTLTKSLLLERPNEGPESQNKNGAIDRNAKPHWKENGQQKKFQKSPLP